MDSIAYLQSLVNNAVGGSAAQIKRVQKWDLYSTMPFYNDSNLNGQSADLFSFKVGDVITGPGFVAASPAYKATNADTNLDAAGNLPFDMFITGLSFDIINRQYTSGTVGTANDMANWPFLKAALLSDMYGKVTINDNDLDRLNLMEAPAGAGVWGAAAQGTSAALTVGASMVFASNGLPDVMNIRNYEQQGPMYAGQNSTIKFPVQFGNSVLTASTVYKPASTGAPTLFMKATLRGLRIWWAS
jgi:hypothetical protein